MNPRLNHLQPYPFEKLRDLKAGIEPPQELAHIALSIGEPKHPTPTVILDALCNNLAGVSKYPLTKGEAPLRLAIRDWLIQRFHLSNISAEHEVLPVTGTREALFAFAQAVVDPGENSTVLMPNPFYQIYEGAAILAGATPFFMDLRPENGFVPDFAAISAEKWQKCSLLYICSPNNPTGSVLDKETLKTLIQLSQQYDFVIASDECYSEIYFDKAPPGLLEVAAEMGVRDYQNCVVFHSLSKRSNAPGLRSGFVAGDAKVLAQFLHYRTYHGCAMPPHHQAASIAAWQDETHVQENRALYQEKFAQVRTALELETVLPDASFYLWVKTPIDDIDFARGLFAQQHVTVLPGSFLSRTINGYNPGQGFVRIALVAEADECLEAAQRINNYLATL